MKKNIFYRLVLLLSAVYFFVSCEKEVSTSPPIEPVPLGFLFVDSSPRGMKIYEDGRNSGKVTPDSLNWLDERQYRITLKRELYRDTTVYVDIVEGVQKQLFVNYYTNSKMKASLKCLSDPEGSKISLNDSLTEHVTPFIFNDLMPGEYKVTYSKDEHRSRSKTILAKSDNETLAYLKLQDTSEWVDYTTDNSPIPEDYLNCIDVDSNKVLWMGTSEYGLVSLHNNEWKIYNSDNSPLPDNYVVDLVVDHSKTMWIATYNGLVEKNGDAWFTHNTDNSVLESNEITTLTVDKDNTLWIGTKKGLYSKSQTLFRRHSSKLEGEPFNYISAVAYDNEGTIWIGTFKDGIGRSTGQDRWIVYTNNFRAVEGRPGYNLFSNMPSTSITAIMSEVDANRIWFGHLPSQSSGPGGISTYNQNYNKFSVNSAYVPSPTIHSFYYGPDKHVWICTARGLVNWKGTHSTLFLDYSIKQITIDKEHGIIWLATEGNGLIKYKQY